MEGCLVRVEAFEEHWSPAGASRLLWLVSLSVPDRCDVLIEAEVNVEAVLSCRTAGASSMPSEPHCIFELPSRAIRPTAILTLVALFLPTSSKQITSPVWPMATDVRFEAQ